MDDVDGLDKEALKVVALKYKRLQALQWRFTVAGISGLIVGGLLLFILESKAVGINSDSVRAIVMGPPLLCNLIGALVMVKIRHFVCPRCGKPFTMSSTSSRPTGACKHCGLRLNGQ